MVLFANLGLVILINFRYYFFSEMETVLLIYEFMKLKFQNCSVLKFVSWMNPKSAVYRDKWDNTLTLASLLKKSCNDSSSPLLRGSSFNKSLYRYLCNITFYLPGLSSKQD